MEIINNSSTPEKGNTEKLKTSIPTDTPVLVALDIGTTKIATIVGTKNKNGKIEILAHANHPSKGVLRGSVANIPDATESIRKCINEAAQKGNVEIGEVIVGIAGQHISTFNQSTSLTISGDEVKKEDIDKMIEDIKQISRKAGESIISVIPQDFVVDNNIGILNPVGIAGKHITGNFHVVSVKDTIVKNLKKCVGNLNIEIQEYYLEPLASAAAVLTDIQKEAGVCLVDIGGGTTDVAIYYDGIIRHSAVIPFGGNVITNDIKEVCKISEKQAEELKIKEGHALPTDGLKNKTLKLVTPADNLLNKKEFVHSISAYFLAQIIQARVQEIAVFVNTELEKSGYKDKLATGIILTGGGSLLKSIQHVFMATIGIETNIGIPNTHISTSIQELKSPVYSTAIGLLVLGFEKIENENENNSDYSNTDTDTANSPSSTLSATNANNGQSTQVLKENKRKGILHGLFSSIKQIFDTPDNI